MCENVDFFQLSEFFVVIVPIHTNFNLGAISFKLFKYINKKNIWWVLIGWKKTTYLFFELIQTRNAF